MSSNRNGSFEFNQFLTVSNIEKEGCILRFFYHTKFGRCLLKIIVQPWISKMIGSLLNTGFSKLFIKPFQKKHQIDINRFEHIKYSSFNDFFGRKLKESEWHADHDLFCSPCDGKLSVYKIGADLTVSIKHSLYTISSLLQDDELSKRYQDGWCMVFRLTPDDYHRYHFIADGEMMAKRKIPGVFHTVRPIAQELSPVFIENTREVTMMKTSQFQTITQIEVGALLVGKIQNHEVKTFKKGEEKGYFLFGGSTIILLLEKNVVHLNPIFWENTQNNLETVVHYQDCLGVKN